MELSQLCAANYHYKRYTLDYFLESAERLGYQSIELWASGPHLHLEDFDAARLAELNRKIKAHHLALRCFTPEQCVYAISVSHPDKVYRDRTVDFFNQHIEAAVQLDCDHMVVSTGFAYLDVDAEDAFGWCAEAMGRIARKAEQEGVTLAVEPFTKYTTHICNEASQLRRLLRTVNSPRLMGLADTDVIATTAVDTFSTFLDVIGRRIWDTSILLTVTPAGIWCPAMVFWIWTGHWKSSRQSIIPVRWVWKCWTAAMSLPPKLR